MAKAILVLSGGWAEDGTDEEIVEGIKVLAETEGVFTETAGGPPWRRRRNSSPRAESRATSPWS